MSRLHKLGIQHKITGGKNEEKRISGNINHGDTKEGTKESINACIRQYEKADKYSKRQQLHLPQRIGCFRSSSIEHYMQPAR